MDFLRAGLGGVAILTGAWWWAEASSGRTSVGHAVLLVVGWLLVAAAAVAVLRMLGTGSLLLVAAFVALAGVALLLVPDGWPTQIDLLAQGRYVLVAAGFTALLWPRHRVIGPEHRTAWAVLWPARYVVHRPAEVTTVVGLMLGDVVLDLTGADPPLHPRIRLFVSVYGGRVTVLVPPQWTVVPGRVNTHAVALSGRFSEPEQVADPDVDDGDESEDLAPARGGLLAWIGSLVAPRSPSPEPEVDRPVPVVETSISGVGGIVTIARA